MQFYLFIYLFCFIFFLAVCTFLERILWLFNEIKRKSPKDTRRLIKQRIQIALYEKLFLKSRPLFCVKAKGTRGIANVLACAQLKEIFSNYLTTLRSLHSIGFQYRLSSITKHVLSWSI